MKLFAYLSICISLLLSLYTIVNVFHSHLQDFAVYYQTATDLIHHHNPYNDSLIDLNYPPSSFPFFYGFGYIPFALAERTWTVLSVICLLGSIFLILKSIKKEHILFFFVVFGFAMLTFPTKFTLGMGQVNLIILFLLSSCFYCYKKHWYYVAGIVLGIAIAIKITPIVLLLFFICKKNSKIVASTILTSLILWIISTTFFGFNLTKQFLTEVLPGIPTIGNDFYYNQALSGFLARLDIPHSIAFFLNYAILLFMLSLSTFAAKRKVATTTQELAQYGLFIIAILIGGGLAWQHHFVLLLIPFVAFFFLLLESKKDTIYLYILGGISYLLISINIKNPQHFQGISLFLLSHVLYGNILLYILIFKHFFNFRIKPSSKEK